MANLVQRLERAEVGGLVDLVCKITKPLIAGELSLWSRDGDRWVAESDIGFVGYRTRYAGRAVDSGPY